MVNKEEVKVERLCNGFLFDVGGQRYAENDVKEMVSHLEGVLRWAMSSFTKGEENERMVVKIIVEIDEPIV